jgi:Putative quorum-sensing-regulated virulence factor
MLVPTLIMTLEELRRKITDFKQSQRDPGDYRLTFGKYRGRRLSETPTDYLIWLRHEQATLVNQIDRYLDGLQ